MLEYGAKKEVGIIMLKEIKDKNLEWALKHVPNVTSPSDILGADQDGNVNDGSPWFYIMPRIGGHLLSNDPEKVLSKRSINFRSKYIHKIIIGASSLFLNGKKLTIIKKAPLPEGRPIIFVPNHGFVEDAISSAVVAEKPAYFLFGSLPQFFNTLNGFGVYMKGCLLINRKSAQSRKSSIDKVVKALELGTNVIFYPEGVFNKTPNQILLPFWPGIFEAAKKSNAYIVPIVHLNVGKQIYSKRLDAIDISQYEDSDRQEFLDTLRDKMGTEIYEMMQKYSTTTRSELLGNHSTMHEVCEDIVKKQVETAGKYYDPEIETASDYRPSNYREVWKDIANASVNASNVKEVNYAKKYVKEDYQRRF